MLKTQVPSDLLAVLCSKFTKMLNQICQQQAVIYTVCELYLPQVACLVFGSNISDDQPIRWSAQLHHQTMLISAEIALSRNLLCMQLLWTKSDIVCQLTLILIWCRHECRLVFREERFIGNLSQYIISVLHSQRHQ